MKKSLLSNNYSLLYDNNALAHLGEEVLDCSVDDTPTSLLVRLKEYLLSVDEAITLVGQNYSLIVDHDQLSIDLLFYHRSLQRYLIAEIMSCQCTSEEASQLNYTLAMVDQLLTSSDDRSSIGLLLDKEGDSLTVRYAIRQEDTVSNIFGSDLVGDKKLAAILTAFLPSTDAIEQALTS